MDFFFELLMVSFHEMNIEHQSIEKLYEVVRVLRDSKYSAGNKAHHEVYSLDLDLLSSKFMYLITRELSFSIIILKNNPSIHKCEDMIRREDIEINNPIDFILKINNPIETKMMDFP